MFQVVVRYNHCLQAQKIMFHLMEERWGCHRKLRRNKQYQCLHSHSVPRHCHVSTLTTRVQDILYPLPVTGEMSGWGGVLIYESFVFNHNRSKVYHGELNSFVCIKRRLKCVCCRCKLNIAKMILFGQNTDITIWWSTPAEIISTCLPSAPFGTELT